MQSTLTSPAVILSPWVCSPDLCPDVLCWFHNITLRKESSVSPSVWGRMDCDPNVLIKKLKWTERNINNCCVKVKSSNWFFKILEILRVMMKKEHVSLRHSQCGSYPFHYCSSNICDITRRQTTNIHQSLISIKGYNKRRENWPNSCRNNMFLGIYPIEIRICGNVCSL